MDNEYLDPLLRSTSDESILAHFSRYWEHQWRDANGAAMCRISQNDLVHAVRALAGPVSPQQKVDFGEALARHFIANEPCTEMLRVHSQDIEYRAFMYGEGFAFLSPNGEIRFGMTIEDSVPLQQRDLLSHLKQALADQAVAKATAEPLTDERQVLADLLWACTERDKKNRIRQFDEFLEAARALLATPTTSKADTGEAQLEVSFTATHEDIYEQCVDLIDPLVKSGQLPKSVVESLQILVEHKIGLDAAVLPQVGEEKDYEALEREHLGDADKQTGIYHPEVISKIAADKIISDYKEHYDFPSQGESHMEDCIRDYLEKTFFHKVSPALQGVEAKAVAPIGWVSKDQLDGMQSGTRDRISIFRLKIEGQSPVYVAPVAQALPVAAEKDARDVEIARLNNIINTPQSSDFLRAVSIEAEHQRQRWDSEHDAGKTAADWFWLIGYLAGKALHSNAAGDLVKAEHHIITTAAALLNWHLAMFGKTDMRPGIDGATVMQGAKA